MEKLNSAQDKNELSGSIDIGSCDLHIVHGAFKTGVESTNWNVKHTLKGSIHLLHDAPSRRAIYANHGRVQYPRFFCWTRWVEDKLVADLLVDIWSFRWPGSIQKTKVQKQQLMTIILLLNFRYSAT